MKIGIIGAGHIGATVAGLWARAGHEVMLAARSEASARGGALEIGPRALSGSLEDVARFGEVVLGAPPYGAWPAIADRIGPALAGRVVIDAANPYAARDGDIVAAVQRRGRGSGAFTQALLPEARVIKAFNTLYFDTLRQEAHRPPPRLALPLAGDDVSALALTADLIRDAGFEPVEVGPIDEALRFDAGTPVYNRPLTAAEMRAELGLRALA